MEVIRLLRNIFLRSFVVGAGLGLLFALFTFAAWDAGVSFGTRFFHTDAAVMGPMAMRFFVALRFFLWFCLLTPGLALHWTLKAEERRAR